MSAPKHTRENAAKPSLRILSIDECVSYAIADGAVDAQGARIPVKHVAELMNTYLSVVYDIASGRRPARARELPLIVRATNVLLPVDAVEHQINRVGIRLPVVGGGGDRSVQKAAVMCREFGELMERYGTAGSDFRYTRDEVADLRLQVEEVYAAAMELIADLEAQQVGPQAGAR